MFLSECRDIVDIMRFFRSIAESILSCQPLIGADRFCEQLLVVTPDLLRKSAPEGLLANILGFRKFKESRIVTNNITLQWQL